MDKLARYLANSPDLPALNPLLLEEEVKPRRPGKKTSAWKDEKELARSISGHLKQRARDNPLYARIIHIPNENSHRTPGVVAGFPDYLWPIARRGYHGFALELKTLDGDLRDSQQDWIAFLTEQGYFATVGIEDQEQILSIFDWYVS